MLNIAGKQIQIGISVNRLNRGMLPDYRAAGFDSAELLLYSADALPGAEPRPIVDYARETASLIGAAGLALRSVHLPFGVYWNPASPDVFVQERAVAGQTALIRLAAELGAKIIVLHASCGRVPVEQRPLWRDCCVLGLTRLADAAREAGLTLAVENLPKLSLVNGSAMLADVTDEFTLASVCFDVNHLFLETHREFIQRAGARIVATHLSDYDGEAEKHWLPGMGVVPWKQVFADLEAAGYSGAYTFELRAGEDGAPYAPALVAERFAALVTA